MLVPVPTRLPLGAQLRWAFLYCSLFKALAVLISIVAVNASLFLIPRTIRPRNVLTATGDIIWFGGFLLSAVADLLIFLGWFPGWLTYQRLLLLTIVASLIQNTIIGTLLTVAVAIVHRGYLEPALWLLLVGLESSLFLASMESQPPCPFPFLLRLLGRGSTK